MTELKKGDNVTVQYAGRTAHGVVSVASEKVVVVRDSPCSCLIAVADANGGYWRIGKAPAEFKVAALNKADFINRLYQMQQVLRRKR